MWPGSGERVAATNEPAASGAIAEATSAAAPVTKPSSSTGTRRDAAPSDHPGEEGDLEPAQRDELGERIASLGAERAHHERPSNGVHFSRHARLIESCSRAARLEGIRREEGGREGARGCGVPDAHLADGEDADAVVGELVRQDDAAIDHLERDVGRHRGTDRDVAGAANTVHDLRTYAADGRWIDHACIDHHEASPRLPCEDGHRGATDREVRQHLTGHRLRIRAHALAHHAVIGGGDDDRGRQGVNGHLAPDRREPAGEILELAKAPRRLRFRIEQPRRLSRHVFVRGPDPRHRFHEPATHASDTSSSASALPPTTK